MHRATLSQTALKFLRQVTANKWLLLIQIGIGETQTIKAPSRQTREVDNWNHHNNNNFDAEPLEALQKCS